MGNCLLNKKVGKKASLEVVYSAGCGGNTSSGGSSYGGAISMTKSIYGLSCGGGNTSGNQNRIWICCYNSSTNSWVDVVGGDTASGTSYSTILDNTSGVYTLLKWHRNWGNGSRTGYFHASAVKLL